jgi:hypothetical protein
LRTVCGDERAVLILFVAGIGLLLGGVLLVRWFIDADPKTLAFAAKAGGIAVVALLVVFLIVSGRIGWVLAVVPFLLPLLLRRRMWGHAFDFGGSSGGREPRTSRVRTRFLEMQLDHASGDLDGEVLEGTFAGQALSRMAPADLIRLFREIEIRDPQSARLLEAYLDRRSPDWRAQTADGGAGARSDMGEGEGTMGSAGGTGTMTKEEAYRVLGLSPGASPTMIKDAHRRLIGIVHPDRGGSSFLAAQVNRAKDVLLHGKPTG